MRLLNTHTLNFEEFEGQNVPSYAILSHRWEEQEVLFKDVDRGNAVTKKGWVKITKCCEQAQNDGLKYAWVDTCCIDKSSSAELTEAINSMFRWYQHSKICYVYLCDVHLTNSIWQDWKSSDSGFDKRSKLAKQEQKIFSACKPLEFSGEFVAEFCSSVWFTRGWTLQELLASENMVFFGHHWQMLGTKDFLCALISHTTCIPVSILIHKRTLDSFTTAERMSWAAKRDTTRIEDRAYSLMGIFGVNMSMLYGEAEGAFIRLQEEILKRSTDQSILFSESHELGLLATSPAAFKIHLPEPANVATCRFYPFAQSSFNENISYSRFGDNEAFALTNIGLSIALYLIPWYLDIYLVPLRVVRSIGSGDKFSHDVPHIFLKQQVNDTRLHRVSFRGEAFTYISEDASIELQIRTFGPDDDDDDDDDYGDDPPKRQCTIAYKGWTRHPNPRLVESSIYGIQFAFEPNECWGPDGILQPRDVVARQKWSPVEPKIILEAGVWRVLAVFRVLHPSGKPSYMHVGFDRDFNPCFMQKEWDWDVTFDDIVEVGVDSDELSQILNARKFDESTSHDDKGQLVIKGSRHPFMYILSDTAIPGIQLKITRPKDGYLFEFRNSA